MIYRYVLSLLILCSFVATSHAATIQLPRTGQTTCYNAAGGVIACAGTGQDGNKLMGVPWPNPRFTDNSNGTIIDNLTGLIWLKNANCFGIQNWATALTKANTLVGNNTQCSLNDGSVAGDWRLPNRKELQSLIDYQNVSPALPAGHPFSNIQASYYWLASSYAGGTDNAWCVFMSTGLVGNDSKANNGSVWPVRAGQ